MLHGYISHRLKWKSVYSWLFFHVTIRIASQACGVAFGIFGFENTGVFIAFLILGTEGYFTLVNTSSLDLTTLSY
jgi:alpha-D-ribose 1-methylphosphonate 5-triphosphate synthase subunit PhnH